MADITITNLSKNNLTITNQSKPSGESLTLEDATFTWDESDPSTWENIRTPLNKVSKNNLTITNVSKN